LSRFADVCVGGDGTLNGMQPISARLPTVLAPKTIDKDLGLNYRSEPDEYSREVAPEPPGYRGDALGLDDLEATRQSLLNSGNLTRPFHSVNTDVNKRIRYLE
jgi:hypothetical protein